MNSPASNPISNYHRFLLLLLSLLICPLALLAQTALIEKYSLTQYTSDHGLPQNSVKTIGNDADGFIWLITEDGLVRFDGQHFYTFNKSNSSITSNRFTLILPSLEPGGAKRKIYASNEYDYEYLSIQHGQAIKDTSYFKRRLKPLHHLKERKTQKNLIAAGAPSLIEGVSFPERYIVPLGQGEGNYDICYNDEIHFFQNWKKVARVPFQSKDFWHFFTIGWQLYYLNESGIISRISSTGKTDFELSGDILKDPLYTRNSKAIELFWNQVNTQALLHLNNNLYLLYPGRAGKMFTRLLLKDFDLKSRDIRSFYFSEKNNIIFFGSLTQGLFVLRGQSFEALASSESAAGNVFYGQAAYGESAVLAGRGIILGKDMKSGKLMDDRIPLMQLLTRPQITPYLMPDGSNVQTDQNGDFLIATPDRKQPVVREPRNSYIGDDRSILVDGKKRIWAKSRDRLMLFSSSGKKLLRRWDFNDEVRVLYRDKVGIIWIGFLKNGLYSIDPSVEKGEPILFRKDSLQRITYIESKSRDTLLVGTESGLFKTAIRSREAKIINGTKGIYIKSIHVSGPEEIWLSTLEGLFLLFNNRLVKLPMDRMNYLASAHCIVEDKKGYLWFPTNKGLFQARKADLIQYSKSISRSKIQGQSAAEDRVFYYYYNQHDGFNNNEFNGGCEPCAVRLPNHYVSLPSLTGLVWFIPENMKPDLPDADIFTDRIQINNRWLAAEKEGITFPSAAKNVRFYFSTPFFGHSQNLHLSYALMSGNDHPGDSDWASLSEHEPAVYFSGLNAGSYTLLIRKKNGFGVDNYSVKKIAITVLPQWYETWWSKAAAAILLIAGTYAYVRHRVKRIEKRNRELEEKIGQRTVELNRSKEQQGKQLQVMSRLVTSMSHDIQSPLNFITRTTGNMSRTIKEGDLNEISEIVGLINSSSKNMGTLIADLLDYIKAYVYGKSLKPEMIDISRLVDKKLSVFKNVLEANGNRVEKTVPADLFVNTDYQMISIVLNNIIDNAAKYTDNGTIIIRAWTEKGCTHLVISNNGKPLSDEILSMFNQKNVDSYEDVATNFRSGLGSFLIREITGLLDVQLNVTQTEMANFELVFRQN